MSVYVLLVVLTLIFSSVKTTRWFYISDEKGYQELIDLDSKIDLSGTRRTNEDIYFYYTSRVQTMPVKLHVGKAAAALKLTDFKRSRPTYIIVHGWHNDNTSILNELVGAAVLDHGDFNLVVTAWSAALGLYTIARSAVRSVAQALVALVEELRPDLNQLTIVGHSLGAHISGIASSILTDKIGAPAYLVGLDPSLPMFVLTKEEDRLDAKDARLVHVIHTCPGVLGFLDPIGQADFYPGTRSSYQPSCGKDITCICSHSRSYHYYAESIHLGGFMATSCDTYDNFVNGKCGNNPKAHMGGLKLDQNANGTYYLHVNKYAPYSQG